MPARPKAQWVVGTLTEELHPLLEKVKGH